MKITLPGGIVAEGTSEEVAALATAMSKSIRTEPAPGQVGAAPVPRKRVGKKALPEPKPPASAEVKARMARIRSFKGNARSSAVANAVIDGMRRQHGAIVEFSGKACIRGTATIKDGDNLWPLRIRDANGTTVYRIPHSDLSLSHAYAVFFGIDNVVYIRPSAAVIACAIDEKRGLTVRDDKTIILSGIRANARGVPKPRGAQKVSA